jgi:peptidoglycan/xylan/chitin deacetylase (PgdA/CDA1 family)
VIRRPLATSLPGGAATVALTFDDGPDPDFTPQVLDALAKAGATATFFLIGERAARFPGVARRIVDEGHAVGSHSYRHPEPRSLGWRVVTDFVRGRRAVERAVGRRAPLFRPPKGYVDRQERAAIAATRAQPWLWTIDLLDWEPGVACEDIVANAAGLGPGDVLLLHDAISGPLAPEALDRSATVAAVPRLVELARSRGLEPVSLPVGR